MPGRQLSEQIISGNAIYRMTKDEDKGWTIYRLAGKENDLSCCYRVKTHRGGADEPDHFFIRLSDKSKIWELPDIAGKPAADIIPAVDANHKVLELVMVQFQGFLKGLKLPDHNFPRSEIINVFLKEVDAAGVGPELRAQVKAKLLFLHGAVERVNQQTLNTNKVFGGLTVNEAELLDMAKAGAERISALEVHEQALRSVEKSYSDGLMSLSDNLVKSLSQNLSDEIAVLEQQLLNFDTEEASHKMEHLEQFRHHLLRREIAKQQHRNDSILPAVQSIEVNDNDEEGDEFKTPETEPIDEPQTALPSALPLPEAIRPVDFMKPKTSHSVHLLGDTAHVESRQSLREEADDYINSTQRAFFHEMSELMKQAQDVQSKALEQATQHSPQAVTNYPAYVIQTVQPNPVQNPPVVNNYIPAEPTRPVQVDQKQVITPQKRVVICETPEGSPIRNDDEGRAEIIEMSSRPADLYSALPSSPIRSSRRQQFENNITPQRRSIPMTVSIVQTEESLFPSLDDERREFERRQAEFMTREVELVTQVRVMEQEIMASRAREEENELIIRDMSAQGYSHESTMQTLKMQNAAMEQRNRKLLSELQVDRQLSSKEMKQMKQAGDARLRNSQREVSDIEGRYKNEIEELRNEAQQLKKKVSEVESSRQDLLTKNRKIEGKCRELESGMDYLRKELSDKEKQIDFGKNTTRVQRTPPRQQSNNRQSVSQSVGSAQHYQQRRTPSRSQSVESSLLEDILCERDAAIRAARELSSELQSEQQHAIQQEGLMLLEMDRLRREQEFLTPPTKRSTSRSPARILYPSSASPAVPPPRYDNYRQATTSRHRSISPSLPGW